MMAGAMLRTRIPRRRVAIAAVALASASAAACATAGAAVIDRSGATRPVVLLGPDDDSTASPVIQPPDPPVPDQSQRKGDQLIGGRGDDVLVGRLGPDLLVGNDGDDLLVGGLERGANNEVFPNFDVAFGGQGDDVFVWAPGDGSDAFDGGEPPRFVTERFTRIVRRNGKRVRVTRTRRVRAPADDDVLVIGTAAVLAADPSQPELFPTRFGRLARVDASGALGTVPPQGVIKGFCEVLPAPPGLGYRFLVRFSGRAFRVLQVTIRVRGVERVLCRADGAPDAIAETVLGPRGAGPAVVRTAAFAPPAGSKLAALVG